jgi:hypothetical protein
MADDDQHFCVHFARAASAMAYYPIGRAPRAYGLVNAASIHPALPPVFH